MSCAVLLAALALTAAAEGAAPQGGGGPAAAPLDPDAVARAVDAYLAARPRVEEPSAWERAFEHLVFYGDFRVRLEGTWFEPGEGQDEARMRLRGRFGLNYAATDELVIGTRVITGDQENARSSHWTLGTGFEDIDFNLDRLFLQWRPSGAAQGATLWAGKFDRPVQRNPVYAEIMWDADVQPEGVALTYEHAGGGALERAGASLAAFIYQERPANADAGLYSAQAFARLRAADGASIGASVEYATFDGLAADDVPAGAGLDYDLLHPLVDATFELAGQPVRVGVEGFRNLAVGGAQGRGWSAGVGVGGLARAGQWFGYYQYADIGYEAVFANLAQDDFVDSAGYRGSMFGVNYMVTDKLGLHLWTLISTRDQGPDPERTAYRARLDVNLRI